MVSINCSLKIDKGDNYKYIVTNLKRLADNGIRKVIITKVYKDEFYRLSADEIRELVHWLNKEADKEKIEIKLYPGFLIQANYNSIDEYLSNDNCGINGGSYILLDIGGRITRETIEIAHNIVVDKKIPVISKPEMDLKIKEKSKRLQELMDMGCLFQLDLRGLKGNYGRIIKKNAKYLLRNNIYDFLEYEDLKELKKLSRKQRKEFIDKSIKLLNNEYIVNHKHEKSKKSIFNIFKRNKKKI